MTEPTTTYPRPEAQRAAIAEFWSWWAERGDEGFATMFRDSGTNQQLIEELGQKVAAISPGLIFEFFAGETTEFAFVLTSEGNDIYRAPVRRWLDSAPTSSTWSFHETRGAKPGVTVEMGDVRFSTDDLRFEVTHGNAVLNLRVHHPAFAQLAFASENADANPQLPTIEQIGFILLDNAFGERAVSLWLGHIEFVREDTPLPFTSQDVTEALAELEQRFPLHDEDKWVVFEANLDDGKLVGRVRPPLSTLVAPLLDLHARLIVPFNPEDSGTLYELEDAIMRLVEDHAGEQGAADDVARLVAVETIGTVRAFHFYVNSDSDILDRLKALTDSFSSPEAEIHGEVVVDPGWQRIKHLRF